MTNGEIIDKVYADMIEQAIKILFQELMMEDHGGRHVSAERRFNAGLKAATVARDRAKILIEGNE